MVVRRVIGRQLAGSYPMLCMLCLLAAIRVCGSQRENPWKEVRFDDSLVISVNPILLTPTLNLKSKFQLYLDFDCASVAIKDHNRDSENASSSRWASSPMHSMQSDNVSSAALLAIMQMHAHMHFLKSGYVACP